MVGADKQSISCDRLSAKFLIYSLNNPRLFFCWSDSTGGFGVLVSSFDSASQLNAEMFRQTGGCEFAGDFDGLGESVRSVLSSRVQSWIAMSASTPTLSTG